MYIKGFLIHFENYNYFQCRCVVKCSYWKYRIDPVSHHHEHLLSSVPLILATYVTRNSIQPCFNQHFTSDQCSVPYYAFLNQLYVFFDEMSSTTHMAWSFFLIKISVFLLRCKISFYILSTNNLFRQFENIFSQFVTCCYFSLIIQFEVQMVFMVDFY